MKCIRVKCTKTLVDKYNNVIGYSVCDQNNNTVNVKPEALKAAIKAQSVELVNMILTPDDRLIDIKLLNSKMRVQSLIDKCKILGQLSRIPTACGYSCILLNLTSVNHIIVIPDEVKKLNEDTGCLTFTEHIQKLHGTIKIVGGTGLEDAICMFCGCEVQNLDLSAFDTGSIAQMGCMFDYCKVQSLDLSSFDTSRVEGMFCMFRGCSAKIINLSSFNTSNVVDMDYIFNDCQVKSLDLKSFNIKNVGMNMHYMFVGCQAQYIDLSSFDTNALPHKDDQLYEDCIFIDASLGNKTISAMSFPSIKAYDRRIIKAYNSAKRIYQRALVNK